MAYERVIMDDIIETQNNSVKYERVLADLDVAAGEDNIIGLVELGVGLEAIGDNILVLIDNYRSGYECSVCRGTGKLRRKQRCVCDPEVPDEKLLEETGGVKRGMRNKFDAPCEFCGGDYLSKRLDDVVECGKCNGKGGSLIIPDTAKSLPTTGVILSVGPDVTRGGIRTNVRVVCTAHSGVFIPMKGNIPVKVFRQHEPLFILYNIKKDGRADKSEPGELATNQFVDLDDVQLNPQSNA